MTVLRVRWPQAGRNRSGLSPERSLCAGTRGGQAGGRLPVLFVYFFTHRVINLRALGRKARGGGGPGDAVQPASPSRSLGSSAPTGKSPQADPGEMLYRPVALVGQKAAGQRVEPHGRGLGQADAEPQQRRGCDTLPASGDRGAELGGHWQGSGDRPPAPPASPQEAPACTGKGFTVWIGVGPTES